MNYKFKEGDIVEIISVPGVNNSEVRGQLAKVKSTCNGYSSTCSYTITLLINSYEYFVGDDDLILCNIPVKFKDKVIDIVNI